MHFWIHHERDFCVRLEVWFGFAGTSARTARSDQTVSTDLRLSGSRVNYLRNWNRNGRLRRDATLLLDPLDSRPRRTFSVKNSEKFS